MRFIHTADWQIGKVFRQFGEKEAVLQQARLDVIDAIAALARAEGAADILVAGDVYDHDAPSERTLREPLERMRRHPALRWHLLPGNHDPHRPQGLWDRVRGLGPPPNIVLHLESQPFELSGAVILPAPLLRRSEPRDVSAWMDGAPSPDGWLRIGLAHGSVAGFGGEGEAGNPIDPARPRLARLDYLALGDWHRTNAIGPNVHYAGTPEPDRFGSQEEGVALLVDIAGPGARPVVAPRRVGRYVWREIGHRLDEAAHLADLEAMLRALPELPVLVARLTLAGALPLAGHAELDGRLQALEAAMFRLDVDRSALAARPSPADLEAIDFDGVLRRSSDRLLAEAADGDEAARRVAEDALVELYLRAVQPAPGRKGRAA